MAEKKVRYTIDLSPGVYRDLQESARRQESTMAFVVRTAIRQMLQSEGMLPPKLRRSQRLA